MSNHFNVAQKLGIKLPTPLQSFSPDWPGAERVSIHIKRDDLMHPVVSGNKWRKLSGVFSGPATLPNAILSFGGGFSNHLHALGYCCHQLNIPFTAVVRGDYSANPTPMLRDLINWGTRIRYVNRIEYSQRHDHDYLNQLRLAHPDTTLIPEGGSQQAALTGVQSVITETEHNFDVVICPVASGATLAGLITALKPQQRAMGIAVLKGVGYLESLVEQFLPARTDNWHIEHDFHHGGYAKTSAPLLTLIQSVSEQHPLPLEPVYSGKVFFALKSLLASHFFAQGSRILVLHTGGLQGARSTKVE